MDSQGRGHWEWLDHGNLMKGDIDNDEFMEPYGKELRVVCLW